MDAMPKRILEAVESMPAFPKSVQKVLVLSREIDCSPKDLVEVIKNDPIFTLKILRVVNSPFVGLVQKINSIHQASVYLGLNTLKNIALNLATIGVLPKENQAGFDMNDFWLHSLAVAVVTQKLGELLRISKSEAEDFFSTGLLHDVGKVVLALYMPDDFKEALRRVHEDGERLHDAEMDLIGATHADIGSMLAQKWGLSDNMVDGIAGHHSPYLEPPLDIVDCVFTANQVCKYLDVGSAGEPEVEEIPLGMQERMKLDLEGAVEALTDLEDELKRVNILIQA